MSAKLVCIIDKRKVKNRNIFLAKCESTNIYSLEELTSEYIITCGKGGISRFGQQKNREQVLHWNLTGVFA